MTTVVTAGERKSLMLESPEYTRISQLAKRANVPRPLVIKALLDAVDESTVIARISSMRAEVKAVEAEKKQKRALLANLAENMEIDDIEALLKTLGK